MNVTATTALVSLAKRELLTLDAQVRRLVCESGTLWITLDRDLRDILLEPGDAFAPQAGERAILYALTPATLTLERVAPAPSTAPVRKPGPRPATRTLVLE